ncbi:MAG: HEAT repeat domain-containing protein [Bacteroidota bacterium]
MDESRKKAILRNLINSLETGGEKDRLYAIDELVEMPHPDSIPVLVRSLADANETIRDKAAQLLPEIDPEWERSAAVEESVPFLVRLLGANSKERSRLASRLLLRFQAVSLPALLAGLEASEDADFQWKALHILRQMTIDTSAAVPALIQLLARENTTVKEACIQALAEADPQSLQISEAIGRELGHPQSPVRLAAAEALGKFEAISLSTIQALVRSLLDGEAKVRTAAAEALIQIGATAMPDLLHLIGERRELRKLRLLELQKTKGSLFKGVNWDAFVMEPYKANQNISWHFKDALDALRQVEAGLAEGIRVVAQIGGESLEAVSALQEALTDDNPTVRMAAVKALGTLGPAAEDSTADLLRQFEQANPNDLEAIVRSLNQVDPNWATTEQARPFLQYLINCLASNERKVSAILALRSIDRQVVDYLIQQLDSKDRIIRKEIVMLLGVLGENARAALPFLNKLAAEDGNRLIREASQDAIRQIEPGEE